MKLVFALALALAATSISVADTRPSDKAVRKSEPPPDKLAAAAGEAFTKAKEADEAGKLDDAARLYRKALAISPHPFTHYNLADVLRRKKDIKGAITAYRKYLEMDPGAKDRAEVEKLIASLEAMPGTMVIELEESDAQVFINGEPVKRTKPFEVQLPAGDYTVDVVTAISHDNERCFVYHGVKYACRLRLKPREDGNIVISGPPSMSRMSMGRSGQPTIRLKGRFHLDPGRHQIYVTSSRERQCAPLEIDVAKGDVVTYVYAETPAKWPERRGECADVKFKRRVLTF
jgi:tetratricopeptide (TPR) repeat protein